MADKFEKPEKLDDLSIDELRALNEKAIAAGREIAAKDDLSDEDMTEAEGIMLASDEIEAEIAKRETAEAERTERQARLKAAFEKPAEGDEGDGDADTDGDSDADAPDEDADADKRKEAVTASAVARAKRHAPAVKAPKVDVVEDEPAFSIVAAANVPGFSSNENLGSMKNVANAFERRSRGFVAGAQGMKPKMNVVSVLGENLENNGVEYTLSDRHQQYGVARIERATSEFEIDETMGEQSQYDTIMAAAKRARLGTDVGALVAAGGWCAPSEIVYGFLELEEVAGILDLPTVSLKRGGIRFTKGPDYGTLAATWGFLQTEAQAEAGTAKTCYQLACPTWTDIRLDAVGFCVTAGILTNAGFPELVNRVLQIGTVAHAHKVNASVIQRISDYIGTAVDWTEVGAQGNTKGFAATSDLVDSIALQATRLRYMYSMSDSAIMEAIFPYWVKEVIRADLGRRQGLPWLSITDADILNFFAIRKVRPQFVYDYQPLLSTAATNLGGTAAWTQFPTKVQYMIFPAGAYTKLTKNVIDLDTIYDSVGLGTNNYTAAFYEEGIAVANTGATGVKVEVALNVNGSSGFPAVGAGSGVSIA